MKGLRQFSLMDGKEVKRFGSRGSRSKKEPLDAFKSRELSYYSYVMRKHGDDLEKVIMQVQCQEAVPEEGHA